MVPFSVTLKDPQYAMYGKLSIPNLLAQYLTEKIELPTNSEEPVAISPQDLLPALDQAQFHLEMLRGVLALAVIDKQPVVVGYVKPVKTPMATEPLPQTTTKIDEFVQYLDSMDPRIKLILGEIKVKLQQLKARDFSNDLHFAGRKLIASLEYSQNRLEKSSEDMAEVKNALVYGKKLAAILDIKDF